jgi:glutathione S-transferase
VDGDAAFYDSTQIFEYLEERSPEPPLYPAGLAERARCRRLEAFGDEIVFPELWKLIDAGFYPTPADSAAAQRTQEARRELAALHLVLDKELSGREYLCERFSVADIGNFILLSTAVTLGAPPGGSLTQLGAWLARVAQRPAVQRELEAMTHFARNLPRSPQPSAAR